MRHDSFFNYALDDFYSSAAFVPAVALWFLFLAAPAFAANPPVAPTNPVGFTTITTPYSSTTSPPQISHIPPQGTPNVGGGSSYPVRPPRPITPIVSNGGFNAPSNGGITITGVKTPPIPTSGRSNYPPTVVKNGAKMLLRGNLGGIILGGGLQALLNGIDALIDEGGNVTRISDNGVSNPENIPSDYDLLLASRSAGWYNPDTQQTQIKTHLSRDDIITIGYGENPTTGSRLYQYCDKARGSSGLAGWSFSDRQCYYKSGAPPIPPTLEPYPLNDLDDAVDNLYNPAPSDFDNLAPYMFPQSYTQNPIPTVTLPTVTTSETNATGDTTTTETTTTIDFTVDNSKPIPDVETTVTENKDEFTNGNPSGSSSTSTTTPANNNPQAPQQGTGGGTTVTFPEIPTDCAFMPTVCAFLDWFKQEPEEPDDNLSELLQEVPIVSETFTITGGSAACPAPLVLNLSQFGSREVSYQPLCDLASTMRFLYLALMSFAAAILLHRSINRV